MTAQATLSPRQLQVIVAMVAGSTITAAAATAGISRQTVYRWLGDPDFTAELARARLEQAAAHQAGLRALGDAVLAGLRDLVAATTPPALRLRACLEVADRIDRASPGPGDLYGADVSAFADIERKQLEAARRAFLRAELARAEAERGRGGHTLDPDLDPDPDEEGGEDWRVHARLLAEIDPETWGPPPARRGRSEKATDDGAAKKAKLIALMLEFVPPERHGELLSQAAEDFRAGGMSHEMLGRIAEALRARGLPDEMVEQVTSTRRTGESPGRGAGPAGEKSP